MLSRQESEEASFSNTEVLHIVGGKYVFHQGEKFTSYEQLMERMYLHSKESMVYYWRRDSRTVENACTKTSRPISIDLKYYSLRFACIYSALRKEARTNRKRVAKENLKRTDCRAFIALRASKCGQYLEVTSVCHVHNHEISEKVLEKLSQTRRMSEEVKEEVMEMLKLKIDRKKIIEYVKLRDSKNITRKILLNLLARIRSTELSHPGPEKRSLILQRILRNSQDKGMYAAVSKELTNLDFDESDNYQIEINDLIESISPEHEFVVDETIIDATVGFREHSKQMPDIFSSSIDSSSMDNPEDNDFITKTTDENEDSALILYDHTLDLNDEKDNIFIGKEVTYNQSINFCDQIGDEHQYISFEPKSELVESAIGGSNTNLILYETEDHQSECGEVLSSRYSDVAGQSSASIVLYETTTDVNIGGEMEEENICNMSADKYSVEDQQTKRMEQTTSNGTNNMNKIINKLTRRISKCTRCRTDLRLVRAQVNYLRARRNKLLIETELLKLKKKKLIHEMKQLE